MRGLTRPLAVAALLALSTLPASAHRGHDAMSVVRITADHRVTVSHRFDVSDIEPALGDIAPNAQPSLDDPDAVRALGAYLGTHFTLATEAGPVRLVPGAVDLSAAEAQFTFTGRLPRTARRLTIHGNVLGGVYPRQVNQVNVTSGDITRTFAMTPGDSRTVTLPKLAPAPRGTTSRRQGNSQPR
jgi:hypothetical protein